MVLNDILKEVPASIVIEDTWLRPGRPLMLALLRRYASDGHRIKYLRYDPFLHFEQDQWPAIGFQPQHLTFPYPAPPTVDDVVRDWAADGVDSAAAVVVAIDSLSALLSTGAVSNVLCAALTKLTRSKQVHVVALLHGDAHDTATRQRFRHVAACHVKANTDAASSTWLATWKKRGGRVVDSEESFRVDSNWTLVDVCEAQRPATSSSARGTGALSAPAAVPKSTFRLELDAGEKSARSHVVLPYLRNKGTEEKGRIVYEAENADWDDEDPDDDLEI